MSIPLVQHQQRNTGLHEARALAGEHMSANVVHLEEMDPFLGRTLIKTGFGESLASSNVDYREYALRTLAMLTAIGDCGNQQDVYLEAALQHGATEAEILSLVDQAAEYVGNPRAVNAVRQYQSRLQAAREFPDIHIQETIIQLKDHQTIIRDTGGKGTPMLLIHALCMDGVMFQKLIPRLVAGTGMRVIAYDMRGHGYARGAPLTQNLEQLVGDAIELLDQLGVEKADVVGSSFGGAVAQYLAIMHPERVRALCPMATGPQGNPELHSRATRAENGEMPALRTEGIIRWFLPETIADNTWCVRYARAKLEHVAIPEWSAAWRAMARLDAVQGLKTLDCPILALAGEKDASGTPARMRVIDTTVKEAGKSNSEYVEIPNGTHMMPMEAPKEVADALVAWRKRVDRICKQ